MGTRVFLQLVYEVVKLVKFGGVYVDDLIFGLQYVFDVLPRHCRETSLHFGQNRSRGETNFLRTSCQVLSRGQVLPTKDHSEDQVRSDANPAASSQILNYPLLRTHLHYLQIT